MVGMKQNINTHKSVDYFPYLNFMHAEFMKSSMPMSQLHNTLIISEVKLHV